MNGLGLQVLNCCKHSYVVGTLMLVTNVGYAISYDLIGVPVQYYIQEIIEHQQASLFSHLGLTL
jgi:hypothetical protein